MKKSERGLFLVEFAITAVMLIIILFSVMELSRLIWIWNTANEATRRGARVAAVCPMDDPSIAEATIFAADGSGGPSPILRGLTTANVSVEYFNETGALPEETDVTLVKYVRVSLNNYTVKPLIPFIDNEFDLPSFSTTIPSESLGFVPDPDNPTAINFDCLMP